MQQAYSAIGVGQNYLRRQGAQLVTISGGVLTTQKRILRPNDIVAELAIGNPSNSPDHPHLDLSQVSDPRVKTQDELDLETSLVALAPYHSIVSISRKGKRIDRYTFHTDPEFPSTILPEAVESKRVYLVTGLNSDLGKVIAELAKRNSQLRN